MPDTPFSAIEPWNVPTADPRTADAANETMHRLAEELRRLRAELQNAHQRTKPRPPRRRPRSHAE